MTEKEITENLVQIKKVALDLKQTETEFVINEKKLIQQLNKYEVNFLLHLRIIIEGCVPGKGYMFHAPLIS